MTTSLPVLQRNISPDRQRRPGAWLELALDYRCNLRCLGCHACHDDASSVRMSSAEALAVLRAQRNLGRSALWIGGGEPTLRDDLPALVKAARALGYTRVRVQTNGMRLSYATYREALVAAGVTELSFNVKSHRAELHDALGQGESHALLLQAIAALRGRLRMDADVLLTKSTIGDLAETVRDFSARGIETFYLWLLSAADAPPPGTDTETAVAHEIPRLSEVARHLADAAAVVAAGSPNARLVSWHTVPCTLPAALRPLYAPVSELGLFVIGPDGRGFPLQDSAMEGGAYVTACATCEARPRCGGPRSDYLALHGDGEFSPLAADAVGLFSAFDPASDTS